jgi:hypothetical protein
MAMKWTGSDFRGGRAKFISEDEISLVREKAAQTQQPRRMKF